MTKKSTGAVTRVARLIQRKLSPDGGLRCTPVPEYLEARARRRLDVQNAFNSSLMLRSGVSRQTVEHRMDDVVAMLTRHARSVQAEPLRVLDVGCSTGVATVEMHRALIAAGLRPHTIGTDLTLRADYVVDPEGIGVLLDQNGEMLQIDIGSWASPWQWRHRDLLFRPLRSLRARSTAASGLGRFRAALASSKPGYTTTTVSLLATVAEELADLRFQEEDIFNPHIAGDFSAIRAANILNRGYFSFEQLALMATTLARRLSAGGLLVVNRTEPVTGINRATVLRRHGSGLEPVESINGGSEVSDVLLQVVV